ncbi:hypothetical protein FALBO_4849 [Fusarium albosuccineum]|uniref:Uncharacterized protein n=1 Tax=Fusarium albosuccineum TaxID=1237068 RepID=A0A8H4LH29_9HYPO|nr:hypothetical protein FALBO_4849 [Fusarium albosuccineum]
MPTQKGAAQRDPELAVFKDKISAAASRIRDTWSAVAVDPDKVTLNDLRRLMAGYDGLLSDLQDEETVIAKDATIHVRIKRKRLPSHHEKRKRRCEPAQSVLYPKPSERPAREKDDTGKVDLTSNLSQIRDTCCSSTSSSVSTPNPSGINSDEAGLGRLPPISFRRSWSSIDQLYSSDTIPVFPNRASAIPPSLKLPALHPSHASTSTTSSTSVIPGTSVLPRINETRQESKSITLPPLSSLRMAWPKDLPPRIIKLLAKKSKVEQVKPLPHDFENSLGYLYCPLCHEMKQFARVTWFTKHLWEKH